MTIRLGRAIRLVREALGCDAKGLAEKAGISPAMLSLIEQGKRLPSKEVEERIAKALGLPATTLASWTDQERPRQGGRVEKRLTRILDDLDWIQRHLNE